MKSLLIIVLTFFTFGTGNAFGEEMKSTPTKKSNKSKWCCIVDGKVSFKPGKKKNKEMCVMSSAKPMANSKSKLTRKYVKTCNNSGGTWENNFKETAMQK